MLQGIHIQNYAVIENLTVEFRTGLNVLTGETGSGKSILVDALSLALGGRASPDVLPHGPRPRHGDGSLPGRPQATVESLARRIRCGRWGRNGDHPAPGNPGRRPQPAARQRPAHHGGSREELETCLLEVHGQSEHVELLSSDVQLDLLDQFAGVDDLLENVGTLYARRRELEHEMEALSQNEQDRLRTIDLLRFQAQELRRLGSKRARTLGSRTKSASWPTWRRSEQRPPCLREPLRGGRRGLLAPGGRRAGPGGTASF